MKYDSNGNLKWKKIYNSGGVQPTQDAAKLLGLDPFGNVFVWGQQATDIYGYSVGLMKYDANGVLLFRTEPEGGDPLSGTYSSLVDDYGNFFLWNSGFPLKKYNPDLTLQWMLPCGGCYTDYKSIALDRPGNLYVLESLRNDITGMDIVTTKYNIHGKRIWKRWYKWITYIDDLASGIAVDKLGNVYITGTTIRTFSKGREAVTIKYDTKGVKQWTKYYTFRKYGEHKVDVIGVDSDSNCYIVARNLYTATADSLFPITIKYDTNGVLIWAKYLTSMPEWCTSIQKILLDSDGNAYIAGMLGNYYYNTYNQQYIIKYDKDGNAY